MTENIAAATEAGDMPDAVEDAGSLPPSEDGTEPAAAEQESDEPGKRESREARYRRQLRETETERDTLAARVEALQRAEVERIAGKSIKQPAGLWAAGVALNDLLDATGAVDATKVDAAVTTARTAIGLAPAVRGPVVPREGTSIHQPSGGNTWEEAFKG